MFLSLSILVIFSSIHVVIIFGPWKGSLSATTVVVVVTGGVVTFSKNA